MILKDPVLVLSLLHELLSNFGIADGEVDMLIFEMPYLPPATVPVALYLADAGGAHGDKPSIESERFEATLGLCHAMPSGVKVGAYSMSPAGDLMGGPGSWRYQLDPSEARSATIRMLKGPAHGELKQSSVDEYQYVPKQDYVGNDRVVFSIEGKLTRSDSYLPFKYKVIYFIKVTKGGDQSNVNLGTTTRKNYCPEWRWYIGPKA